MSYLPWQEILRRSIDAHERDAPEAVRSKLKYVACDCCRLPGGDLPFLEAMLAVAGEDSLQAVKGYAGEDLAQHMTEAVRGYLCGVAREAPFVMVFEDLHWADEASISLLENVCGLLPEHPILVICLLRADRASPAWAYLERVRASLGAAYLDVITLEPLSAVQSRELLGLLLHIEDLPESVRGLILQKAEGNPFFVEEVIRSLLDSGHIVQQDGRWRATSDIVNVAIPNTLAGLLSARIDRLPETTKRVAQMSAVIGRAFGFRVLETICHRAPPAERIPAVEPHLQRLTAEEIVRERARQPELEYAFKHALTQEAAYNSLLLRRRKEFHARAGEALEALYSGHLDEQVSVLAHHFWLAEDWDRAAEYAQRAGDAAMPVYAMREAITQYDRALAALDHLPDAPPERLYSALMAWSRAAYLFKPYPEQLRQLKRAEEIARDSNDKRRLAEALYKIGAVKQGAGHSLGAIGAFAEAFRLAEELGDESMMVTPSYFAAFGEMDADPQRSVTMFDRAIALARKHGDRDLEAYALSAQGMALARLGRFEEAHRAQQAASQIVAETGSPLTESDVELFTGWAYLDVGDGQKALQHGQRGVDLAIAADNVDCICAGMACLGFAHLQNRDLPQAAEAFQEAIVRTKRSGALKIETMASGGLCLVGLAQGKVDALDQLEAAAARARELDDPFTEAMFSQAAAEAYLERGNLEQAEARLAPALDYYRRNAMQPYLARATESWDELRRRRESQ
jgi:tetratricopeptide (TPR) repeat protein